MNIVNTIQNLMSKVTKYMLSTTIAEPYADLLTIAELHM